jgi:hypothetical protein
VRILEELPAGQSADLRGRRIRVSTDPFQHAHLYPSTEIRDKKEMLFQDITLKYSAHASRSQGISYQHAGLECEM